eukprot:GHVU01098592.1.p2 GENE.GHVU01098592.1~~GHVU01098592.1.p2  ORF type:complete len:109 (-),score=9.77 GHVU01098592.1:67-393(-)
MLSRRQVWLPMMGIVNREAATRRLLLLVCDRIPVRPPTTPAIRLATRLLELVAVFATAAAATAGGGREDELYPKGGASLPQPLPEVDANIHTTYIYSSASHVTDSDLT